LLTRTEGGCQFRFTALRLIRAVNQLCQTATPDDATLSEMQETWTREQQLEILTLVGNYHTVSFVAKTSRLPGEHFGAQFPG